MLLSFLGHHIFIPALYIAIAGGFFVGFTSLLIWRAVSARSSSQNRVLSTFCLDSKEHALIASDLGNRKDKMFLSYKGVTGSPDAIFRALKGRHILVGEFKGRQFRNHVRLYEYYQVILYIGLAQLRYKRPAGGLIAYSDGHVIPIAFDSALFNGLMKLRSEAEQGRGGRAPPLHKRQSYQILSHVRIPK